MGSCICVRNNNPSNYREEVILRESLFTRLYVVFLIDHIIKHHRELSYVIPELMSILSQLRSERYLENTRHYLQQVSELIREIAHTKDILLSSNVYEMNECVICLESFQDKSADKVLLCGHIFHDSCMLNVNNCPLCRVDVS